MEEMINYEHRLTEVEQRSKSNTRRIDGIEQEMTALNKLATAVEVMATEQKNASEKLENISDEMGKMGAKVETLEAKPGKKWENMTEKIVAAILLAVVAFFLGKAGL